MTRRDESSTTGGAGHELGDGRALLGELVVRIYDRGPEPDWHRDRSLFGPWHRFEARLSGEQSGVSAVGWSPWEAAYRLIAAHREIAPSMPPQAKEAR